MVTSSSDILVLQVVFPVAPWANQRSLPHTLTAWLHVCSYFESQSFRSVECQFVSVSKDGCKFLGYTCALSGFSCCLLSKLKIPPHTLTAWGEDSLRTLSMQEGHDWWIGHAPSATAFFKIANTESNIKSVRPTEMLYFVNSFKARLPLRIFCLAIYILNDALNWLEYRGQIGVKHVSACLAVLVFHCACIGSFVLEVSSYVFCSTLNVS